MKTWKNHFTIYLLILLLLLSPVLADASAEASVAIAEIIITGNTRTHTGVIIRQLPFKKGDMWREGYRDLVLKRLQAMNMFDPTETRVTMEIIEPGKGQVIIRVCDGVLLYLEPLEFVAFSLQDLLSSQYNLTLYNPLGNGLSFSAGFNWNGRPAYKLAAHLAGGKGWILGGFWSQFDSIRQFYPSGKESPQYTAAGTSIQLTATRYATERFNYGISMFYSPVMYSQNPGETQTQNYLSVVPRINWEYWAEYELACRWGTDLTGNSPSANAGVLKAKKEWPIGKNNLVFALSTGYMSPGAPLNQQFVIGGFGSVPLRGHKAAYIGDSFLTGSFEYRYRLNPAFWLIGFVDTGRMSAGNAQYPWITDIGAGLAINTPLGYPFRIDIAQGMTDSRGIRYNFGFDLDF